MNTHPLEHNAAARAYYESLYKRASRGSLCVWREAVECCTGWLPTWAERKQRRRDKLQVIHEAANEAN